MPKPIQLDFSGKYNEQHAKRQTGHIYDVKQLRRHSSFSDVDWKKLVYFYEAAFGSAIKGL